jgi:hypothetical protein
MPSFCQIIYFYFLREMTIKLKYSHLFQVVSLLSNFLHMKRMDFTYEVIGDHIVNLELHMIGSGIFTYRCKIVLTFYLNYFYVITSNSLTTFKLLIFILINFSLLISTLLVRKASQIWEIVEKCNTIVAILLD